MSIPPIRGPRTALRDVLTAFAGGSLLRFALRTLVHRAPLLVWLAAALLVPWTALLAAPPAAVHFPSDAARAAWIAYDIALFVGLSALARRFNRSLARLLAVAAGLDAVLGTLQLSAMGMASIGGPVAAALVAAALLAPFLVCALLIAASRAPP